MEFVFRRKPARNRLAVFPGAFNPPTRAHEAMALAALAHAEEVVLTLSARMPHKPLDPSEVEQRLGWMRLRLKMIRASRSHSATPGCLSTWRAKLAVRRALSKSALSADEMPPRTCDGLGLRRLAGIRQQLSEFTLLVAPRLGKIEVHPTLAGRIEHLDLEDQFQALSSTEARQRIEAGERWEDLVPARIAVKLIRR